MEDQQDCLFSGLKVLDVGSWIAAPVSATILADFGADVIKVEMPEVGDAYRQLASLPLLPQADENYTWQMDARNKRSLSLNLKSEEGMQILYRLIKTCDVYITNHPLPMRRALKLTYEELKPLNPAMIYASLTAYGETGPDADREGFDLVAYWARSGMMDLVRSDDSQPAQSLPGMGDHPSAISLYAAIVTALLKRERSGEGGQVHTSLLANGLWSASCIAQAGFAGSDYESYRVTRAKPVFARTLYEAKDLRWLQFNMVRTQQEFEHLLHAVGLSSLLEDERFATDQSRYEHAGLLVRLFQELIAERDSGEWLEIFSAEGINASRVAVIEELASDEQILANAMIFPIDDPQLNQSYVIDHPVKVDSIAKAEPRRAPELGEHTEEILDELGYSLDDVKMLRNNGVI